MSQDKNDLTFMARALELARAQLGRTAPNPSVGCVLVSDGYVVGEAATGDGGRPHAEEQAIALAGEHARGAVAYVTLDPCTTRSSGVESCSARLIGAGVKRVVISCSDPHPNAANSVEALKASGIDVVFGVLEEEALALNAGFFKLVHTGRPLVGVSADGDGFDAEFDLMMRETFEAALERLGNAGMTRVWVRSGTPLVSQMTARNLIDFD